LKKLSRLANSSDLDIQSISPLTDTEVEERQKEYLVMAFDQFRKKYRHHIFSPAILKINGVEYMIQLNYCYNPFCKWYGLPQKQYDILKYKPSRYRLSNTRVTEDHVAILCNDVEDLSVFGNSIGNTSELLSNWSVAEEIKRLITINTVLPVEPDYQFHKDGCSQSALTPFIAGAAFYKRGKSSANSAKFQCKECRKITNVLPAQSENFGYKQSRNEVMVQLAKDLLSRTPVKRTCEKLGIASGTYYNKLERLYSKCLEFLSRHEMAPLQEKKFSAVFLNTDMMIYNLNNIRLKGKGGKRPPGVDKKSPTYLVASGDMSSGYIFRSDIAYDSSVTQEEIEKDTLKNRCDHSYPFLRKNERLRYPYAPQPPTASDWQSALDFQLERAGFENRKNYVEGLHVKPQYTATAHYWLLKQMLHTDSWYFISDDDATLQSCVLRLFSDLVREEQAHYFTCTYDKALTLEEAGKQSFKNRIALKRWGADNGYIHMPISQIAQLKLEHDLAYHDFYDNKIINGTKCAVRSKNPIKSPFADKDEGERYLNCITDTRNMTINALSNVLVQINSRAINNFFQELRRRVSILERPLVTSRGEGKSYIYANYNPKYAQYVITIFRTFYNFCWKRKYNGVLMTPAQRLGIASKAYDYKDIIYFI
jgi:hypothetical protein